MSAEMGNALCPQIPPIHIFKGDGDRVMLKFTLFIMILIIVCIFSLSLAYSNIESQTPGRNNLTISEPPFQQEASTTKEDNDFSPKQVPTTSQGKTNQLLPQKSNADQDNFWQKFWKFSLTDLLLAIFTCLLVAVGALQACILKGTLKVTAGLLRVSQEQSRHMIGSLAISEKAADAAKASADILHATERAYLFAKVQLNPSLDLAYEKITFGGNDQPVELIPLEIIVTNHGKTPAILMNVDRISGIFEDTAIDDLAQFDLSVIPIKIVPGTEIINSGESRTIDESFSIDAQKRELLTNEKYRIVCFGRIQYQDVFGKPHDTIFCWQWGDSISNFYTDKRDHERNKQT